MNNIQVGFLILNETDIAFWGMIGTWVAALGTIFAAVTAIIISMKSSILKLIVRSNIAYLPLDTFNSEKKYIQVEAVNNCDRTITVENIYFRLPNKSSIILPFLQNPYSSKLPHRLEHSDKANWFCSLSVVREYLKDYSLKLDDNDKNFKKWRIEVHISNGQIFEKKLHPTIIEAFNQSIQENKSP